MTPSPQASNAPLPPLPTLPSVGSQSAQGGGDAMQAMLSGIAPVKMGVDQILAGARAVVQSGAIPGAEQVCGQIIALATSLLPMAAQQMMTPGGSGIPPVGGPPPGPQGGPQPILGQ